MAFVRMIHLLALGLWTGGVLFFMFFTALPIIGRMKELATTPGNWAKLVDEKQGVRMAGEALDVVFEKYFVYQIVCGAIALGTALLWINTPGLLTKVRIGLLAGALGLALVNWLVLAPKVHDLRLQRYSTTDSKAAVAADEAFPQAHSQSLIVDMSGLALALLALALAAWLPPDPVSNTAPPVAAGAAQP